MEISEYSKLPYSEIKCYTDDFVEQLQNHLNRQNMSDAIIFYKDCLKTSSYVGVIKYKNFQLEILPKLLGKVNNVEKFSDNDKNTILNNLIYMLSFTKKLDIKTSDNANLYNCENPFLEILIREFAQSLFDCLKRLTPKNYVREEDNLNFLRGKLKFNKNIKFNCTNQAKFYCEFDEFSENNILNQLFLYVSTCLFSISKNNKNKKILSFIINYFSEIKLVKLDKVKVNKIILTRNQKMFERTFKLAKMFIEKCSVDLSKNKIENITLLWDMNILFEEYIYELINKKCKNYRISYQHKRRLLKSIDNNREYGNTYVDIFIETQNKEPQRIILDTKYKINSGTKNDFENKDIYQVVTYSLIHNTNKAILLYPTEITKPENYSRHILNSQKEKKSKLTCVDKNYKILLGTINLNRNLKEKESEIIDKIQNYLGIILENKI